MFTNIFYTILWIYFCSGWHMVETDRRASLGGGQVEVEAQTGSQCIDGVQQRVQQRGQTRGERRQQCLDPGDKGWIGDVGSAATASTAPLFARKTHLSGPG